MSASSGMKRAPIAGYAVAAGALGLAVPALAEVVPLALPGGLPVQVDASSPVLEIDLDGDTVADFELFYLTDYGGGFAIAGINSGDSQNRVYRQGYVNVGQPWFYHYAVLRHEPTEATPSYGSANWIFDAGAGSDQLYSTYNLIDGELYYGGTHGPFREQPGFIALYLQPDSGTMGVTPLVPKHAYLEIVVDPLGQRLKLLSGGVESDTYTEIVFPAFTAPQASALGKLAAGAR